MLETISGQYIFKMLLKHRCLTTWSLCIIFKTLTKFHNHTPKLTLRFKLLLNILNFVLVVKSTSPSGYSYTSAPFAFLILAMKLSSALPVFVDTFSIYIKVSNYFHLFLFYLDCILVVCIYSLFKNMMNIPLYRNKYSIHNKQIRKNNYLTSSVLD